MIPKPPNCTEVEVTEDLFLSEWIERCGKPKDCGMDELTYAQRQQQFRFLQEWRWQMVKGLLESKGDKMTSIEIVEKVDAALDELCRDKIAEEGGLNDSDNES